MAQAPQAAPAPSDPQGATFLSAGARWEDIAACDVERLCRYIPDDGTVASYFRIPRHEVQAIRANMKRAEVRVVPTMTAKAEELICTSTQRERDNARIGSDMLYTAIERMFARFENRHNLPKGAGQKLQLSGYRA